MSEQLTYNNFKSTTVRGNFINADAPDNSVLANGTFDRNLNVKGSLNLGNFDTETGGNIVYKYEGNEVVITPKELITAVNPQLLIIDDFLIYFDQFTIGSQYSWAML